MGGFLFCVIVLMIFVLKGREHSNLMNGYKTYILMILGLMYAIGGYATGHLDAQSALGLAWASLSGMAVRHALTTQA